MPSSDVVNTVDPSFDTQSDKILFRWPVNFATGSPDRTSYDLKEPSNPLVKKIGFVGCQAIWEEPQPCATWCLATWVERSQMVITPESVDVTAMVLEPGYIETTSTEWENSSFSSDDETSWSGDNRQSSVPITCELKSDKIW